MAAADVTLAAIRLAVREELAAAGRGPLLVCKADAIRLLGYSEQAFDRELEAARAGLGTFPLGRKVAGYKCPMWRVADLDKWLAGLRPQKD